MKYPRSTFLFVFSVLLWAVPIQAEPARNPIIWADVPDVAAIRVGDTYYMSSTTMHMSPGCLLYTSDAADE